MQLGNGCMAEAAAARIEEPMLRAVGKGTLRRAARNDKWEAFAWTPKPRGQT